MTGQAAVESFEPEKCDVDGSKRAFYYLQGYLWSLDGCQSALIVRLYRVDAAGHAHKLAGPDEDNNESTNPFPVYSNAYSAHHSGAATVRQPLARGHMPAGHVGNIPSQHGLRKKSIDQHERVAFDPVSDTSLSSYVSNPYMSSSISEPSTQAPGLHMPGPYQHFTAPTPLNSPYYTPIDIPRPRPGPLSPGDLFTPALTSTSRNSSISSISTAYFPTTSSNYITPPNLHASSSVSSSISSSAIALHGLSRACTSPRSLTEPEPGRPLPGPETYKVRIQGVRAGVSEVQFHKDVLEKKFGIYTQHAGIKMVNKNGRLYVYVGYYGKEGAKKVAQELNNFKFMGKKLQVQLE
ncbi:hypothetical protein OEA41_000871 [Lepraria neglecta]|uniref:Uncharacterized protein n=1 Tax=Lepraria neglecta TaxID=209136 RepID=A0AAE0DPU7_9LECA|nr:hypothetical protein OEA41_000871 [Lepraria neglecta]